MNITIEKHNPLSMRNERMQALEEAYNYFNKILEEYSMSKNLNDSDLEELKLLIKEAYLDKKLNYFLETKLSNFNDYLDFAMASALNQTTSKQDSSFSSLFYLRHTKQLLTNERGIR